MLQLLGIFRGGKFRLTSLPFQDVLIRKAEVEEHEMQELAAKLDTLSVAEEEGVWVRTGGGVRVCSPLCALVGCLTLCTLTGATDGVRRSEAQGSRGGGGEGVPSRPNIAAFCARARARPR